MHIDISRLCNPSNPSNPSPGHPNSALISGLVGRMISVPHAAGRTGATLAEATLSSRTLGNRDPYLSLERNFVLVLKYKRCCPVARE
jgi:hypothetical protein